VPGQFESFGQFVVVSVGAAVNAVQDVGDVGATVGKIRLRRDGKRVVSKSMPGAAITWKMSTESRTVRLNRPAIPTCGYRFFPVPATASQPCFTAPFQSCLAQ